MMKLYFSQPLSQQWPAINIHCVDIIWTDVHEQCRIMHVSWLGKIIKKLGQLTTLSCIHLCISINPPQTFMLEYIFTVITSVFLYDKLLR